MVGGPERDGPYRALCHRSNGAVRADRVDRTHRTVRRVRAYWSDRTYRATRDRDHRACRNHRTNRTHGADRPCWSDRNDRAHGSDRTHGSNRVHGTDRANRPYRVSTNTNEYDDGRRRSTLIGQRGYSILLRWNKLDYFEFKQFYRY